MIEKINNFRVICGGMKRGEKQHYKQNIQFISFPAIDDSIIQYIENYN